MDRLLTLISESPTLTGGAHVFLAMILGGLVGVEREISNRPAGLRTHMLVSGAAALLMVIGLPLVSEFSNDVPSSALRVDPLRVIEAIVTGVAFIGAGTIIQNRDDGAIRGLTTAASLLFTAAIAICVTVGKYGLAIIVTVFVLFTLRVVKAIEQRVSGS